MVIFIHPLHLFHEGWESTANLVGKDDVLAFGDLFRNRTVRINGSEDGFICLLVKFSSETSNHRSEEHTSELQSRFDLVCRLLLEKKKTSYNCITEQPSASIRQGDNYSD